MSSFEKYRALDEALNRLLAGGKPDERASNASLLETASALRSLLAMDVAPKTCEAHLALLEQAGVAAAEPAPVFRRRVAVVGLAAAMVVTALTGSAFAVSRGARPGETIFGVKRAFERIGLAMHRSEDSRAAFALKLVSRRLAELRAAAGDDAATEAARAAYEEALSDAEMRLLIDGEAVGVDALLDDAEQEFAHNVAVLNELLAIVPSQAQSAIQRALDRANQAQERISTGRAKRNDPADRPRRSPDGSSRGRPAPSRR